MTPLLEVIYSYVLKNRMSDYLDQKEYERDISYRGKHEADLKATLTEKQKKSLEYFMEAVEDIEYMEAEAIFCAGLSIGLELGNIQ